MELRGEIRRGYFVAGLSGLQFALPQAVEQLRAASESDELVVLNASDPATVFGGELKDIPLRFARIPSTHVVLWRGQLVLVAEDNGERLTTPPDIAPPDLAPGVIGRALQAYLARPAARTARHVVVSEWNGEPVIGSEGQLLLETLGFYRAPNGMEWWASG